MELSEKEAHCVARLLQDVLNCDEHFDACCFCKYEDGCKERDWLCKKPSKFFQNLAGCLTEVTGVEIMPDSSWLDSVYKLFQPKKYRMKINETQESRI